VNLATWKKWWVLLLPILLIAGCRLGHWTTVPDKADFAYATDVSDRKLVIVDTDTGTIVRRISISYPWEVAIASNGKVYVTIPGDIGSIDTRVAVYNTMTGTVKHIGVGRDPRNLVITPQGKLYVLNQEGGHHGTVSVIDTETDTVIKTIDVGLMPWAITASSDGKWVYVTRDDPGYLYGKPFMFDSNPRPDEPEPAPATIAIIDTELDEVVKIVGLEEGSGPQGLAYQANKLYLSLTSSQTKPDPDITAKVAPGKTIIVLNAPTMKVLKRIPVLDRPKRLVLAPNGNLYVTHRTEGYLTVIDTARDEVIKEIPIEVSPGGPVSNPPKRPIRGLGLATPTKLYVTPGSIIIDTTTNEIVGNFSEDLHFRSIAGSHIPLE